ncbi:MAG TPA: hypothetical protein VLL27_08830 [Solirubrobacterales bacterium]|nr:hypothetical protein [Solirubrobacterales bacterium]
MELAEKTDVNKETISLWRGGGQKAYTYEKVKRVAERLGTTAEALLDIPVGNESAAGMSTSQQAASAQREFVRRVAELGPVLDRLADLEEVVEEAMRLNDGP